jgi:metal-sulfur cluster biosynthetic enzyme
MPSEKQVLSKLREVLDPEVGINIVDLGLIYGVKVEGPKALINMTFTTPACPLLTFLVNSVESKVKELNGIEEVEVNFVWEPRWTPDRMIPEARKQLGFE